MSLVESLYNQARAPLDIGELNRFLAAQQEIFCAYHAKELDEEALMAALREITPLLGMITLGFAGPLYGLLRKMGYSQQEATETAEHERAHYFTARDNGLHPHFKLGFFADSANLQAGQQIEGEFQVLTTAKEVIHTDSDDARTVEALIQFIAAPEDKSIIDLNLLPQV